MKSFKHYLLILAISILPFLPSLLTRDLPHTHDGMVHLVRIAAYFKELSHAQLPVRWATDLNYGYGLPLFNFIYQLPYLLASGLLAISGSLIFSFKGVLFLSFLFSGIFAFSFAKAFFKDLRKAWLFTIFYQFAPFRLIELFVRGSFGECLTYTFLPLVLWGLVRSNFFVTAIATALLILSHNSISLVYFAMTVLFLIFFVRDRKPIVSGIIGLVMGLALSAFYWLPALLEHKYTYGNLLMRDLFRTHFAPISQFLLPNFNNASGLQTGGVAMQFGLFQVIAIILGILSMRNKLNVFALMLVIAALFLMTPVSLFLWEKISLLRQFQFPWRFLSLMVIATALLSVNYLRFRLFAKTNYFFLLLIFTVISTAYYWFPPLGFDRITSESVYWNYPLNTTYFGETDVIWSAGPAKAYPKARIETSEGEVMVVNFQQKGYRLEFAAQAKTAGRLVAHLQYFPGWRVYVDGQKTPIEFQNPDWRGLVTFPINPGNHQVVIKFGETPLRLLADLISGFGLLSLIGLQICLKKKLIS